MVFMGVNPGAFGEAGFSPNRRLGPALRSVATGRAIKPGSNNRRWTGFTRILFNALHSSPSLIALSRRAAERGVGRLVAGSASGVSMRELIS